MSIGLSRVCARGIATPPSLFSRGKSDGMIFTHIPFFGENRISQVQMRSLAYFPRSQKSVSRSLVERRTIYPLSSLARALDKRVFSTQKMRFEAPCNPTLLMNSPKQTVRLRNTSFQEVTPSKGAPQVPPRWGQVGLILFLTFCILAGVEAPAEESVKEEDLLNNPIIASFA